MRRLFRSLAPLVLCFLLLPGFRSATADDPTDGIRRCVGSADVYVEGGDTARPAPDTPANPSTDLSGPQAVLHAQFERGLSLNGQGQVQYTLVDQATLQPVCAAFGPVVDDGTDSPYVVQEALQTGFTYGWVARSYDGKYYSQPTTPQTFTFEPGLPPDGNESPQELINDNSPLFEADMRSYLGDRFAYVWVVGNVNFNVGVVNPTPLDATTVQANAAKYGAVGVVVPATYSASQLDAFQLAVEDVVKSAPPNVAFADYVDPAANEVVAVLKTADVETISALRTATPAGALRITVDASASFSFLDSRSTYPPYKAGRSVHDWNLGKFCTSGFTLNKGGAPMGLTAGHCADIYDEIDVGNEDCTPSCHEVGIVTSDDNPTGHYDVLGDAAMYSIVNKQAATSLLYINSSFSRNVIGERSYNVGNTLCYSGRVTGIVCDRVVQKVNVSVQKTDGHYIYHQDCFTDQSAAKGDSGGGIYNKPNSTDAYAGGSITGDATMNGTKYDCFDPMSNIRLQLMAGLWFTKCHSSYFCVWVDINYGGGLIEFGGNVADYTQWANVTCYQRNWDDCASAAENDGTSGLGVYVYQNTQYTGGNFCIPQGVTVPDFTTKHFSNGVGLNDAVSSHRWSSYCG
jgi:hypothetical protein